ncbi:unnamed protein product [Linum trigynum]|uniref:Uncharacterized protein n=1 Tax=Linum trigynum TaxID=586398 RepID=A0AAV2EFS0_9ROSI
MQRTKQKKPTTLLLPCALSSPTNKPTDLATLASDKLLPYALSSAASLTATAISSSSISRKQSDAFNLQPSLAAW